MDDVRHDIGVGDGGGTAGGLLRAPLRQKKRRNVGLSQSNGCPWPTPIQKKKREGLEMGHGDMLMQDLGTF